ncbi:MAG: hypothetical protein Q9181_005715 [Wetmoreana brouardii]
MRLSTVPYSFLLLLPSVSTEALPALDPCWRQCVTHKLPCADGHWPCFCRTARTTPFLADSVTCIRQNCTADEPFSPTELLTPFQETCKKPIPSAVIAHANALAAQDPASTPISTAIAVALTAEETGVDNNPASGVAKQKHTSVPRDTNDVTTTYIGIATNANGQQETFTVPALVGVTGTIYGSPVTKAQGSVTATSVVTLPWPTLPVSWFSTVHAPASGASSVARASGSQSGSPVATDAATATTSSTGTSSAGSRQTSRSEEGGTVLDTSSGRQHRAGSSLGLMPGLTNAQSIPTLVFHLDIQLGLSACRVIMEKDIAIIGMACRVAGANSPFELWDNLLSARDVQRRITRFNIDGFYHPHGGPLKGLINVDRAYMLHDAAVDKFDNAFFHTTPAEAPAMDPQQRMLLEVSYEAIENAGIPLAAFTGTGTAVFTGTSSLGSRRGRGVEGSDYHTVLARDPDVTPKYIVTGTAGCMAANRLSYFYDLSGPSISVDTACSSSMAALHQAVRTLQHGDCPMALVCGTNLIFNPESFVSMTELGFLSASGRCRSFDAAGDGYGRGEGIACVLLKPLKKAIDDHDPIRAVIKGTRLNQDGRTQGITLPSTKAQRQNMDSLYQELAIDPSTIQYLEAHGTGTAAGDPLELQAVSAVYGACPLVVGSVKSNVGHCEAASALIGLIKTVLCLENAQIPAQMYFDTPNPAIDFSNFIVPTKTLPWPDTAGHVRRAAINTFGAGGTNGHAVLETYNRSSINSCVGQRPWLFKLSAADELSLKALKTAYAAYLEYQTPDLRALAHTLVARRSDFKYSQFFVASSHDSLRSQLLSDKVDTLTKSGDPVKGTLFVFTGQGAQWAQMGCGLMNHSPLFKSVLQACEDILRELPNGPSWSILDELSKEIDRSSINDARFSQPLCTALQIGIVLLLRSWGIRPDAVVGHSSGEIGAAFAAGMIPMRTAIVTAYYRGRILASSDLTTALGAMCAVGMSEDDCKTMLKDYQGQVEIAALNSPCSCTLSGDREAIHAIVDSCAREGFLCRLLKVKKAYHSHHMLPLGPRYEQDLRVAAVVPSEGRPQCPMYSSVTQSVLHPQDLTPEYWARNMTSTVRFSAAIKEGLNSHPGVNSVIEIGPHPALKGPTQEILRQEGRSCPYYFNSCKRGENDFETLLHSTGAMIAAGLPLDLRAVNATSVNSDGQWKHNHGAVLTDIPGYQWNHTNTFWLESRDGDLPGLSPSICLLMALEAARQTWVARVASTSAIRMTDMKFFDSIFVPTGPDHQKFVETHFISRVDEVSPRMSFEVLRNGLDETNEWVLCCSGNLEPTSHITQEDPNSTHDLQEDRILLQKAHLLYPSLFRYIEEIQISNGLIRGRPVKLLPGANTYPIHPLALGSILSVGPTATLGSNLPSNFRVHSISNLQMLFQSRSLPGLSFKISTDPIQAGGAQSRLSIHHDGDSLLFGRVQYAATSTIPPKPITTSLFFRPVLLPDISKHFETEKVSIENLVLLATHKWPMIDVKIGKVPETAKERLLEILDARDLGQRRRVRSIQLYGDIEATEPNESFQTVKQLTPEMSAHMIFTQGSDDSIELLNQSLRTSGLICVCNLPEATKREMFDHFEYVCVVTGLVEWAWTLWRVKDDISFSPAKRQPIVFSNHKIMSQGSLLVNLRAMEVRQFASQPHERFDAIIIDEPERSIITEWSGKDLIPWLQYLMKHAESLLWVSPDASSGPFGDIAGTLLRTLQAEQPSLKVSWLVLDDPNISEELLMDRIERVYGSTQRGDNEVRLEINQTATRILRYMPDEALSTATGVSLPLQIQDPIGDRDYALALAAPGEPVVLSFEPDAATTAATFGTNHDAQEKLPTYADAANVQTSKAVGHKVKVSVKASLLGSDDLAAYNGHTDDVTASDDCGSNPSRLLGTFFAGVVLASTDPSFMQNSLVVGWAHGAHVNYLDVPSQNLYQAPYTDYARTVATFAIYATIMAALEGHIRARSDDHVIFLNRHRWIYQAFVIVSWRLQLASPKCKNSYSRTFTMKVSHNHKLLVDEEPVHVVSYLASSPKMFRQLWDDHDKIRSSIHRFDVRSYKEAFRRAYLDEPTVLIHGDVDGMTHVPIYRQPTNPISRSGAHIIIGGLGGLGRYVCSWLVDHGTITLYAISRSGIASPEAQQLYENLNSIPGVTFQVIKADACDRDSMSSILSDIRSEHSIIGVINMAMVLGDAPMASMTGEQWDRALRVKIDSSWILHELTLDDQLDYFILFSSIASVLGNRNQGSYNVGNAFLNALATYRRRLGKTGVAIALGAMSESFPILYPLPLQQPVH